MPRRPAFSLVAGGQNEKYRTTLRCTYSYYSLAYISSKCIQQRYTLKLSSRVYGDNAASGMNSECPLSTTHSLLDHDKTNSASHFLFNNATIDIIARPDAQIDAPINLDYVIVTDPTPHKVFRGTWLELLHKSIHDSSFLACVTSLSLLLREWSLLKLYISLGRITGTSMELTLDAGALFRRRSKGKTSLPPTPKLIGIPRLTFRRRPLCTMV